MELGDTMCTQAINRGDMALLFYGHQNNYGWYNHLYYTAATSGNFDALMYLYHSHLLMPDDIFNHVACGGNINSLRFVVELGIEITPDACNWAVTSGSVECLQYLIGIGANYNTEQLLANAIIDGGPTMITYIQDNLPTIHVARAW